MPYSKIKLRRGTAYEWNSLNPVLEEGEIVVECPDSGVGTGLSKFKIGDGSTPYSSLPYAFDGMRASAIDGGGAEKFNVIQIRGAKASTWESVNPILNNRELGFDMTNISIKVGNGKNNWNDLPFIKASDFTGMIIDCGDEENPEEEDDIEYEEDYDDSTPSDPDGPDNPDDPEPDPDDPTPGPDDPDDPTPGPDDPDDPTPEPSGETLIITDNADSSTVAGVNVNGVMYYNIAYGGTYEVRLPEDALEAVNTRINIMTSEAVRLNLQDVTINNSALNDDTPVITTNTSNNTYIYCYNDNTIIGNGSYLVSPAAGVILSLGEGELHIGGSGSLDIQDPMPDSGNYEEVGSTRGISANGLVLVQVADLTISSINSCIRAAGDIVINKGTAGEYITMDLESKLKNGLESATDIQIQEAEIDISAIEGIGISATNGNVAVLSGEVNITSYNGISAATQNIEPDTVNIITPGE